MPWPSSNWKIITQTLLSNGANVVPNPYCISRYPKKKNQNKFSQGQKISFIKLGTIEGVFMRPKGITTNSQ